MKGLLNRIGTETTGDSREVLDQFTAFKVPFLQDLSGFRSHLRPQLSPSSLQPYEEEILEVYGYLCNH